MRFEISTAVPNYNFDKIYCAAKYYNEIFEFDCATYETKPIGMLEGEEDTLDLVFNMDLCEDFLFILPRNGKYSHIINLRTGKQKKIMVQETVGCRASAFFSARIRDKIYLVGRDAGEIIEVNLTSGECTLLNKQYQNESIGILSISYDNEQIVFLDAARRVVFLYDIAENRIDRALLDMSIKDPMRIYLLNRKLYIYDSVNAELNLVDNGGNILQRCRVPFSDSHVSPAMKEEDGHIFVYSNRRKEIIEIDRMERIHCIVREEEEYLSFINMYDRTVYGIMYDGTDNVTEFYYYDQENRCHRMETQDSAERLEYIKNEQAKGKWRHITLQVDQGHCLQESAGLGVSELIQYMQKEKTNGA